MDLQGILFAEIAKTKKRLESTKSLAATSDGTTLNKKKYIRRGEVEKLQEREYRERQLQAEKERKEKEEKKRQELAPAREQDKNQTLTGDVSNEVKEEDDAPTFNIPAEEVVRRLRAKNQPIRLFAETDKARKLRLRALELIEERSEGQRNDFMETLGQYETRLDLEALKRQAGEDIEDEGAGKRKRKREDAEDTTVISLELLQKDSSKVYTLIYVYLKRLLKEWEQELRNQPDDLRRSNQGKLAAAMQKQSTEYIKPFLRHLKKKEVEPDVLARITEIIQFMQNREYVNANDAYLRLSIGNAPWPIGVTMVGIHERSSREKIHASSVAHVLNDEQARKWIQSIKRIMTFCQTKYPPPDNSQLF